MALEHRFGSTVCASRLVLHREFSQPSFAFFLGCGRCMSQSSAVSTEQHLETTFFAYDVSTGIEASLHPAPSRVAACGVGDNARRHRRTWEPRLVRGMPRDVQLVVREAGLPTSGE